ncbi:MAG: hypothetical protein JNL56_02615 [Alphaproteobacteria bacterium]|nr:hypothetical protein [Alphaproteobacteria bacterium]
MILHASIPADDPERVARVFAELWKGEAVPFPPIERSWMAYAHDGRGSEVEISPRDLAFIPGPAEMSCQTQPATPRFSSAHLLVSSVLSPEEILAIGAREGWTTRVCRRGGPGPMGFDLIEMWLENAFMLEIAPDGWAEKYLAFMAGEPARQMFALKQVA